MSDLPEFPKYIPFEYGNYGKYDLKQVDEKTWHVRNDGMPVGTLMEDEGGFYKPGSDARHPDFEAAVRLTIRGTIR